MARKNKNATINDLAKSVSKDSDLDKKEVKKVIKATFGEIKKNILEGKKIGLSGFGSFEMTKWKKYKVYDPNTGDKVERQIKTVYFNPSRKIKDEIKKN